MILTWEILQIRLTILKRLIQVSLPNMNAGGLDVSWFIVYTGQDSLTKSGFEKAAANRAKFSAIHRLVNDYTPDQIELARLRQMSEEYGKAGEKLQ